MGTPRYSERSSLGPGEISDPWSAGRSVQCPLHSHPRWTPLGARRLTRVDCYLSDGRPSGREKGGSFLVSPLQGDY